MKIKKKKGFTLIELLIVVAIIAILAAIAIPQFSAYRIKGYNAAAQSDLRNVATSEEAYFADTQQYFPFAITPTGGAVDVTGLPGAKVSKGVRAVSITPGAAGSALNVVYSAASGHIQGDRAFGFESDQGKFVWFTKVAGTDYTGTGCTAANIATTPDIVGTVL